MAPYGNPRTSYSISIATSRHHMLLHNIFTVPYGFPPTPQLSPAHCWVPHVPHSTDPPQQAQKHRLYCTAGTCGAARCCLENAEIAVKRGGMEPWGGGHGAPLRGQPQGDPPWGSITPMGASWQGERQPGGERGWHGAVAQLARQGVTRWGVTRPPGALCCAPSRAGGASSLHTCAHSCNPHHALFCPTHVPPT